MDEISIRFLTLLDFDEYRENHYSDVVEPADFLANVRDPLECAKMAYCWGVFPRGKPSFDDFLDAIDGDGYERIRRKLLEAYRDFCPTRFREKITEAIELIEKAPELELDRLLGEFARSNLRRSQVFPIQESSQSDSSNEPQESEEEKTGTESPSCDSNFEEIS